MTGTTEGATCVHIAAERGLVNVLQTLLRARPELDVMSATDAGLTPLHLAAGHHSVAMLELLVARGAQVSNEYWK